MQCCPSLGHRLATSTDRGLEQVASEILKAVDLEKYDEAHPIFLEQQRKAVCRFLEAIEEEFKYASIFHPPHKIVLQEQYIPIEVTLERRYRHEVESMRGYLEDEMQLSRAYALKGMLEGESRREQVSW